MDQIFDRQPLENQGGDCLAVERVRHRKGADGGQVSIGRIAVRRTADIGDPITDIEIANAVANSGDDTDPFDAQPARQGQLGREDAPAMVDVDIVHADGEVPDLNLAGSRRGQLEGFPA